MIYIESTIDLTLLYYEINSIYYGCTINVLYIAYECIMDLILLFSCGLAIYEFINISNDLLWTH